jgi:hypothetical protein
MGFRLTNTSELSRVSILGTSQGSLPLNAGQAATGQLGLDFRREGEKEALLPRVTLRPGETGSAQARITQPFPLGSTAGSLRIHARELASPVELQYEVRVRRGYGWLFWVAMLGVFAGNGLRWLLNRIEELGKARSKLDEQLVRLRGEGERHQDATFRSSVDGAVQLITRAFSAGGANALVAAFNDSETRLQAALKTLQETKEGHVARLKVLRDLASGQYRLPAGLRSFASGLSASLPPVAALLDVDDVTEAGKVLDTLEADVAARLAGAGREWSDKVSGLLVARTPVDAVLPAESPGATRAEVGSAVEAFASASGDAGGLKERVSRLDAAWRKLADFVRSLVDHLVAELEATRQVLLQEPAASASGNTLLTQAADLRRLQQQRPDEPEAVLEHVQANLPAVFRGAILACMTRVAPPAKAEVSRLIDEGAYVQAARKAIELAQAARASSPEGTPQGGAHVLESFTVQAGVPAASPGTPSASPPAPAPLAPSWWSVRSGVLGGAPAPSPLELTRYWQVARVGVMLFMGALLSAVTTALFADGWIGTWEDVLKVFVWASALDITASSVTSTLSRLKKEPGPARDA